MLFAGLDLFALASDGVVASGQLALAASCPWHRRKYHGNWNGGDYSIQLILIDRPAPGAEHRYRIANGRPRGAALRP